MQKTNPIVTVICTCFNHRDFIKIALDSVLNQSYKNIELLIIDDCSKDDSVQIIKHWIDDNNFGTLIKNKNNLGLTKSFNNAVLKSKGDYLIDLAADDELLPHCIALQISVFNAYKTEKIGIVYGNASVINKSTDEKYVFFNRFSQEKMASSPKDGFIYKELIDHSNTICSVSAMIKRNVFMALGGYDERLIYEDYDFWLRLARTYYILYVDEVLVNRIKLENSLGSLNYKGIDKKNYKFKQATYMAVKKTLAMNKNKEEDQATMRKILLEIKVNIKILNLQLLLKYTVLLLNILLIRQRFKTTTF
ncbi:glycosyltransferase [Lacinutrix neustonica]|uniref:Glycosyltransferase n=1 Tax=Lacinutrix neustonica TaxID=2980107 RepID=A0A9E8SF14_9FLAO|nr:glycosyltransferase [Lacinutrix neustonica]WAC03347.1 glycosyltransferase [Lacinutrix neustonica]